MHLKAYRVQNFRRLKDVVIDLEDDVSIFVGANNSGKTSATQIIKRLLDDDRSSFSFYDFNCECWPVFDEVERGEHDSWPSISVDLWFSVRSQDLHRVLELLPSLQWRDSRVGIRMQFAPSDPAALLQRYNEAKELARPHAVTDGEGTITYGPWPNSLRDYLKRTLKDEYKVRHYVLDIGNFENWRERAAAEGEPALIADTETTGGRSTIKSLIRVDYLSAQRHLSDQAPGAGHSRAEELSRCFNRFYERHLEQRSEDHGALQALAASEIALSAHFTKVFGSTLTRLGRLGYPGFANPRIEIRSTLRPERLMSEQHASVHYRLDDGSTPDGLVLPDSYNGLGFKNLIYMVIELLDLHESWLKPSDETEARPPLHLIFIEEPEAHMHAQLQQAFVRQVMELLKIEEPDSGEFESQVVITTHSPHILYERGFEPIRYFRRTPHSNHEQHSEVHNLSAFADGSEDKNFLARYMKLTHCDLFFADAAILVEGNVERLLIPEMIQKTASDLASAYLSILEVGGAFAHKFGELINFIGLTTLVITDIDSVHPKVVTKKGRDEQELEEDVAIEPTDNDEETHEEIYSTEDRDGEAGGAQAVDPAIPRREGAEDQPKLDLSAPKITLGESCQVLTEGALSSNAALRNWLPGRKTIAELLAARPEDRELGQDGNSARVRITYQGAHEVTWKDQTSKVAGRTFEEAFALENLEWTQSKKRRELGLWIRGNAALSPADLAKKLYNRVGSRSFSKTDFALAVLASEDAGWVVPSYIADGLKWLDEQVTPELLKSRREIVAADDEARAAATLAGAQ